MGNLHTVDSGRHYPKAFLEARKTRSYSFRILEKNRDSGIVICSCVNRVLSELVVVIEGTTYIRFSG